ncbi:hypothetical protein [Fulvivirga sedimenti]|uniref:Uncharacterized protein n=1 Tax=Fulvivirga sedimenti TaxID=2879465 RepID=A0A9X1HPA5_9BACT|nr:hypothetical protein [Fulvivirga sedimenti]MCA6075326.1 hypothetical protein [Fulvivirga sedimenti]MCA6076503.1 hypothetical protein [Fulvivirga sedimenti]MCA6077631.1 hypothetical protein [Fulvivirga sedimenti]
MNRLCITVILLIVLFNLERCSSITQVQSSSTTYEDKYLTPNKVTFKSTSWLINALATNVSQESRIELTEQILKLTEKRIGDSVMFITAAIANGLAPADIDASDGKMLSTLCDKRFRYVLQLNLEGNESEGGGFSIGADGEDNTENSARVELMVFTVPDGEMIYHHRMTAWEVTPSESDFDDDVNQMIINRSNAKIQKDALNYAIKKLQKKSNLPIN